MKPKRIAAGLALVALSTGAALFVASCGKEKQQYDMNLLANGSFEEVRDGVPVGWKLAPYRGLENQQLVEYRVDETTASEGKKSWTFKGDPGTRRWMILTQEVEVTDVPLVRLSGAMKLDHVNRKTDQHAQCNFLLTFFDEHHNRFQLMRIADKRTPIKLGTQLWTKEDYLFRVPQGTHYIAVSCILGMDGQVWFDDVSLTIPQPIDWQTQRTRNFVFHWLASRPFPPGAIEAQQKLFDNVLDRLHLKSDVVIQYYLYPDTTTIQEKLSIKGFQYVSWDDFEFHSINPNDNHEFIHFIMDEYGTPTRSIAEGTVFWLQGSWNGVPVHIGAADLLRRGLLPSVAKLTTYNDFAMMKADVSIPAAASWVGFIVERWGPERFVELHRKISGANSYGLFAQGFERTYRVKCEDAEEQWRQFLSGIDPNYQPSESKP
jgi:hypothetical protein